MSDNPSTTYPEKVRASHFSQTGFEMRQAIAPSTSSPDERVFSAIYDAVQGQRLVPGLKLKEMELANPQNFGLCHYLLLEALRL